MNYGQTLWRRISCALALALALQLVSCSADSPTSPTPSQNLPYQQEQPITIGQQVQLSALRSTDYELLGSSNDAVASVQLSPQGLQVTGHHYGWTNVRLAVG